MIPVAPSGQAAARAALLAGLDEYDVLVPVSTRLPDPYPAEFIVLSRTGGGESDFAGDTVRLLVECYATGEWEAERLALAALAALRWVHGRMVGGHVVGWSRGDGPVRFDNPDTDTRFRFQFTGALRVSL